jgi:hypothetical protein
MADKVKIKDWLQQEILTSIPDDLDCSIAQLRATIYRIAWETHNKTLLRAAEKIEEEFTAKEDISIVRKILTRLIEWSIK